MSVLVYLVAIVIALSLSVGFIYFFKPKNLPVTVSLVGIYLCLMYGLFTLANYLIGAV